MFVAKRTKIFRSQAWRWRKQSLQGELSFQRLLKSPELLETLVDLGDEMSLGWFQLRWGRTAMVEVLA